MFAWFHNHWVSRAEHEQMILDYEEQLARMEKLVEMSMEAATEALKRSSSHISLVATIADGIARNTPTKH